MKTSKTLFWLSTVVVILGLAAAALGLFYQDTGSSFTVTNFFGQTVTIYGHGTYRNDTTLGSATFRGTDAVTLFIAVPLMLAALYFYRRGSLRGGFLLVSMLGYFLYNSSSLALSAAYNHLFLLYIAYFSASLFAFVMAFNAFDLASISTRVSPRLPRRGIAAFLIFAGVALFFVWLSDLLPAILANQAPAALQNYTTIVTYAIDLGIITPAAILAGILVLRRTPLGYPLAAVVLILNALIGLVVIGQTVVQQMDGVYLTLAQVLVFSGSFVVMAVFAVGLAVGLFRSLPEPTARSS